MVSESVGVRNLIKVRQKYLFRSLLTKEKTDPCGRFFLLKLEIGCPQHTSRDCLRLWRSWQTVHTAKGGILPGEEIFHTLALNHAEDQSLPRAANSVFPGSHSEYPYCGPSSDGLFFFPLAASGIRTPTYGWRSLPLPYPNAKLFQHYSSTASGPPSLAREGFKFGA